MLNLKITGKKKEFQGNFLSVGTHDVTIVGLSQTKSDSAQWADATPQLKVEFKNEEGATHTEWYQLRGYKKFSELSAKDKASNKFKSVNSVNGTEDYAVNIATGMRVEDEARTQKCMDKLAELANVAGVAPGQEIDAADLEGAEMEITIHENAQGKRRIHYANPVKA